MTIKTIWIYLVYAAFSACAAEVHVNRWEGNDSNSGTAASPVATLARGVSLLAAGGTLVVTKGAEPYYESLNLGARSGGVTNPIVVEGNGATLSGLVSMPSAEWTPQVDGTYKHPHKRSGSLQPYLMDGEREVPKGVLGSLVPYSHCWTTDGLWFRPAEGKTLGNYQLRGAMVPSGVAINNGSYIKVRNLICERFANDGFNVHGSSRGLLFENIVGRFNGDDGFSIHEDIEAVVYGGHFHGNNYGIQDVNASQSVFHGLLVESNRLAGVDFYGGYHSIFDSVVRANGGSQVSIAHNTAAHIGFAADNPMCQGLAFLKNVVVSDGTTGVKVGSKSALVISACTLQDVTVPANIAAGGEFWVISDAGTSTMHTNAVPYMESFEAYAVNETLNADEGWEVVTETNGSVTITDDAAAINALTNSYTGALPLNTTHLKVMKIDEAEATLAVTNSFARRVETDFMLLATRHVAGESPTIDPQVQTAFYVSAEGKLGVIHAATSDGVVFSNACRVLDASPVIAEGSWARITVLQDYTCKMFQVRLNGGGPIIDMAGWSAPGGTRPGTWFHMINRENDHMKGFRVNYNGLIDDLLIRISPWIGTLMSLE